MIDENSLLTANQFVNVSDIKGNFLYSKDGNIFGYLAVGKFNKDLLSKQELKAKTQILTSSFESDRKEFSYFAMQREIDLDGEKKNLEKRYMNELVSVGNRHILKIMLNELIHLSTNGQNYEHQHYIKIWQPYTTANRPEVEAEVRVRLNDIKARYEAVGITADILGQHDIIKVCSLFASAAQAPFIQIGKNTQYEPMVRMKG